jgi:tetratricopeptide (TPR) repeat protein
LAGLLVVAVAGFLLLRHAGTTGHPPAPAGGASVGRAMRPVALLAVAWPAACMLPVLNLVPIPIVVADRYLYLALLGPFLALASWWVAGARIGPWSPSIAARAVPAAAVLLAFAFLSHRQSLAYKDTEALWRQSLASQEANPVVRLYLASEILAKRPTAESAEEALALLHPAIEGAGESQGLHVARSQALDLLGRKEEAEAELERAMELGRKKQLRWETATHAARRLAEDGKYDEAHGALRLCRPRWSLEEERLAEAHAEVCLEAEDFAGYLLWNAKLLRWQPFSIILWNNREAVARRLGLAEEAGRAGRRFEELQPPEGAAEPRVALGQDHGQDHGQASP